MAFEMHQLRTTDLFLEFVTGVSFADEHDPLTGIN